MSSGCPYVHNGQLIIEMTLMLLITLIFLKREAVEMGFGHFHSLSILIPKGQSRPHHEMYTEMNLHTLWMNTFF